MKVRACISQAAESARGALTALLLGGTVLSLAGAPLFLPAAETLMALPAQAGAGAAPSSPDWSKPLGREERIWHLLSRITFGPRQAEVARAGQIGIDAYLDEQLHPERLDDAAVESKIASLSTLSMSAEELAENFPPPKPAAQRAQESAPPNRGTAAPTAVGEKPGVPEQGRSMEQAMAAPPEGPRRITMELAREQLWRALYSQRQLQELMVQFWMNHFNIFAGKGADRWLITSFERDTIRPNALAKFEDLLVATAQSPAMLFYLDNWMSVAPYTGQDGSVYGQRRAGPMWSLGRGGRGVNSPFGPGLGNPPPDRALRSAAKPAPGQASGKNRRGLNENYARELMELHTLGVDGGYTQQDVREVARCFTGWSIDRPQRGGGFVFRPRLHDRGQKVVLGHKIKKGHGIEDGLQVLHLLARHPSTAHFISLKLCRRFVADDPPPSLVDRASQTYLRSRGDIRAVLKAILTSPEFYSQAAFRAKVKSPFELVASSLRALDGETDGGPPLLNNMVRMGQPLFYYQAPTGFPDRASAWINSGTLLQRINFATLLAAGRIRGTSVDLRASAPDAATEAALDELSARLLGGLLPPETRAAILKAVPMQAGLSRGGPDGRDGGVILSRGAGAPRAEVAKLAALVLASPEFQRR